MSNNYTAEQIEVLTGLQPVQLRPEMYTITDNPNHIAHEAIDNASDEAMIGFADKIEIIHYKDGSLEVIDNGRGMPVDIHPEEGISGVELIMTRLHAGSKFSNKNYKFSGGLHGVGISVLNALCDKVIVTIKRYGKIHQISFAHGDKTQDLTEIASCSKKDQGTSVRFWPSERYFHSVRFALPHLKHVLRAKAVLCPGLKVTFQDENIGESKQWYYQDGLSDYLQEMLPDENMLPESLFLGQFVAEKEMVSWALTWLPESNTNVTESYVNLIPTINGGTHVNGLRTGLLEALREFCELRNLLPRGLKLTAEDVIQQLSFVLSLKMAEPQFVGQTKERLSSRQAAAFVNGVVKDAFSLWLNQHISEAEAIAGLIISHAQKRSRQTKQVERKRVTAGPLLPGKLSDCSAQELAMTELFLVEGDSAGGSAKQARDRSFQAIMPLRGKILNTWEVASTEVLASQEVHDIAVALGIDPGSSDLSGLRYGKICILADADPDGMHIATLLCALFLKHFHKLVAEGHLYVAMPPLYRIDIGKEVYYALDDEEKQGILDRLAAEKKKGSANIQRFKGLGEMNPMQLRETTMAPDTRRLVQLSVGTQDGDAHQLFDMLLTKKRAIDRKKWLEDKGNLAELML